MEKGKSGETREDVTADNLSRYKPTYSASDINHALIRANNDQQFLESTIKLLDNKQMQFPAFMEGILKYISNVSNDIDVISLFQSLDGYIKFKDIYQVQKAIEENDSAKKMKYQIADITRNNPVVRTRDITTDTGTKEKEAVNLNEERSDYPEVTPTAMSEYICSMCGKSFQTRDDLVHHQNFEKGNEIGN
ncbi:MAG TPA: C2H2-type zinc finger protein [Nitrososphaeraceae archaeon]|jgi:hypothetical protein